MDNETLLNATNLNNTNTTIAASSSFIDKINLTSILQNEIILVLIFIVFVVLILKAIHFAKKLIFVGFISVLFPVFIHYFIDKNYALGSDVFLHYLIIGCTLFILYYFLKPILKILKIKK